jgi:hypothetical protein
LATKFSSPQAVATPWLEASAALEAAGVYWLATVTPAGAPHVTPIAGIWWDNAMFFATGPAERKQRNLAENPRCVVTTGCNSFAEGLDIVIEGDAVRVTEDDKLQRLAALYDAKYAPMFHFEVRDGFFVGDGGDALVYRVQPRTSFGFARRLAKDGEMLLQGGIFSQTRWRFDP